MKILKYMLVFLAMFLVALLIRASFARFGSSPSASRETGWPGTPGVGFPGSFDIENPIIPAEEIRSGGPPKDGIPALTDPSLVSAAGAGYLSDQDLVVGVNLDGETRAYPLRILVWHENANDTVGQTPIAVTYCPLCQSTMVFDRRVGGQTREFGISGLLYNSNVLLYDRQEDPKQESLWSQGELRAVSGPAAKAGLRLTLLPSDLTTWGDWKARHLDTQVLSLETGHRRSYGQDPYAGYFASDELMFPVAVKIETPDRYRNKELMAVVYTDHGNKAYAVDEVAKAAGPDGLLPDRIGELEVKVYYVKEGPSIRITAGPEELPVPVAYMYWFVLASMQANVPVYTLPGS